MPGRTKARGTSLRLGGRPPARPGETRRHAGDTAAISARRRATPCDAVRRRATGVTRRSTRRGHGGRGGWGGWGVDTRGSPRRRRARASPAAPPAAPPAARVTPSPAGRRPPLSATAGSGKSASEAAPRPAQRSKDLQQRWATWALEAAGERAAKGRAVQGSGRRRGERCKGSGRRRGERCKGSGRRRGERCRGRSVVFRAKSDGPVPGKGQERQGTGPCRYLARAGRRARRARESGEHGVPRQQQVPGHAAP